MVETSKNKRLNAFRQKLQSQQQEKLSIPKFGLQQTYSKDQQRDGQPGSSSDLDRLATLPTLASDSSPFRDKYEMDEDGELIGEGTHGVVRECKDKVTGEIYAVKIFRSEDEEMFIHAEREFKILQRLKGHPNIVQGKEYIPELLRSRGYIVMEKVFGHSLQKFVMEENEGPLDEQLAKNIVRCITSGIHHMHNNGVVHRDMNPTNVFYNEKEDMVKILDFNVSKLIEKPVTEADLNGDQNMSGEPKQSAEGKARILMFTKTGTPLYTAPEMQLSLKYTEKIDMWGLGTIVYLLLMGELPFTDQQMPILMDKVSRGDFIKEGPQWDKLSEEAKDFVLRLLEVDVDKRLASHEAIKHQWLQ